MSSPAPLNAVRVFVIAARMLSIKKAAEALFVTPGAVSRQIQALERHLGVPLFERKFREISLTQLGTLYLAQVEPAIDSIDGATRRLREMTGRALVRVDAMPTFAMYWLIPRLALFQARHPDIDVKLTTSSGPAERGKDVDLGIRRDPSDFNGLRGEAFMTEWSALVCSPRFPGWKRLRTPDAVLQSTRIAMRSRADLWPKWLARHGLDQGDGGRSLDFDNTILAIQAVVEGLGVGLIPRLFLDGLLKSGTLLHLPASEPLLSGAYHVLQPHRTPTPAAAAFRAWLREAGSAG